MKIAERNRLIKKVLEHKFGRGKVRVKGSRGTGYGWVHVHIETPKDWRYYSERHIEVMGLLTKAGAEFGTYGYDDPGSDYGCGKEIIISFHAPHEQAA
jgi:hypothetical protein